MQNKLCNITIALAGMAQAVSLIKDLAQTGKIDETAYRQSIYSIFQINAPDVPTIYGDLNGIKFGLEQLILMLEPRSNSIQIRYMLALMRLQKKISRSKKTLHLLTQRLNQGKKQVDYFSLLHPTVITNLADIYLNIIAHFKFHIIIWGNQRILSAPENMEKIRALLLAGIRSSVLWRQMGGSHFQLIFFRSKIRAVAKKILAELETNATTDYEVGKITNTNN